MLIIILFIIFVLLFLTGMFYLRTGLYNNASNKLKNWLITFTDTPFKGLLVGIIITILLQSSSAVMVLTIGFIAAKILTFRQSVGIILGTNIGTTFTLEFITFSFDQFVVPMALGGFVLVLFSKGKLHSVGFIFLGLAAIFSSMKGFEYLASPLASYSFINHLFMSMENSSIISILLGTILTGIIQSSTATTGMMMGFLKSGIISIDAAIGVMLGANIGTCVTAYIASIGSGIESRLCAWTHIWLNVIGVILFFPLIPFLSQLAPELAATGDVQLAHISVIFNCVVSLLFLPFSHPFAQFIQRIHGKK